MLRRWLLALRLVLAVQIRAYFPHIYLGIALLGVAAFRFAIPQEAASFLLPLLLLGEQGVVAMTLAAAQVYLERNEGSSTALAVTPLRDGEYVAALVAGSSVFACVSGAVIWAGAIDAGAGVILLAPILLLLSLFSGLTGIWLTSRFDEFTSFLIGGAVAATAILSLPLLSYVSVTPRWSFFWLPSDWALGVFAALSTRSLSLPHWLIANAVLGIFCLAAFVPAARAYHARLRRSPDGAS